MDAFWTQIIEEAEKADRRYGPFRSSHEGLGVLVEEVYELVEAIRSNELDRIYGEAIQVSAVASRIAVSMEHGPTQERSKP